MARRQINTEQLKGGVETPGINQVYGTDGAGVAGFKPDPSGGGTTIDTIFITRAQDAAPATLVYAHGLGVAPSYITFHAYSVGTTNVILCSDGAYNGSTNKTLYASETGGGSDIFAVDGTKCVSIVGGAGGSYGQAGAVTATTSANITIDRTRFGAPFSTVFGVVVTLYA